MVEMVHPEDVDVALLSLASVGLIRLPPVAGPAERRGRRWW
jgi:hypothetical protein